QQALTPQEMLKGYSDAWTVPLRFTRIQRTQARSASEGTPSIVPSLALRACVRVLSASTLHAGVPCHRSPGRGAVCEGHALRPAPEIGRAGHSRSTGQGKAA